MGDNQKRLVGIDLDGKRNCQTSGCHGWAIRFPKTGQEIFTFKAMTFVQGCGRVSFESMLAKSLKLGKTAPSYISPSLPVSYVSFCRHTRDPCSPQKFVSEKLDMFRRSSLS